MMNKKLRKAAKKAGFIFWSNESYGPGKKHVDWSCVYDDELNAFATGLINKCAAIAGKNGDKIRQHFRIQ